MASEQRDSGQGRKQLYKELLATFLAVQTFAKSKRVRHIRLKVDNMTAVYYNKSHGGNQESISNEDHYTALELVPAERHCTVM